MIQANQLHKHLREIVCFGIVGVLATAVHYTVALLAIEQLHLSVYLANLAGYLCALCVSFFGHGIFTFRISLNKRVFARFIVISISTFLASEALLIILERHLQLPHRIAMAVVVCFIPVASYLLNKFWVYRQPNRPSLGASD